MNVDGKSLCGQIQFEADIDPMTTTICHCTDCPISSGTAFIYVVGAVNNSFKLLEEKLSFFIKIADSGAKRELAFCGVCGTRVFARPVDGKTEFWAEGWDNQTKKDTITQAASMEEILFRLSGIN